MDHPPTNLPHTSNDYTLQDSFEFSSIIDKQNPELFIASLDVDSLFTNVPLDEAITIAVNKVCGRKRKIDGIKKSEFKDMLDIAIKGSIFYFNGSYYRQVDGVAMGSPLGLVLANIFLCHHEMNWLRKCPTSFTPVLYKRYVDDIVVLMDSKKSLVCFFRYMNSKHPNMSFTYETEENDQIPFLDILVCRSKGKFNTSTYRKPTFSGVYQHFCSFMPIEYKFGLIRTLLHRCYSLVSS